MACFFVCGSDVVPINRLPSILDANSTRSPSPLQQSTTQFVPCNHCNQYHEIQHTTGSMHLNNYKKRDPNKIRTNLSNSHTISSDLPNNNTQQLPMHQHQMSTSLSPITPQTPQTPTIPNSPSNIIKYSPSNTHNNITSMLVEMASDHTDDKPDPLHISVIDDIDQQDDFDISVNQSKYKPPPMHKFNKISSHKNYDMNNMIAFSSTSTYYPNVIVEDEENDMKLMEFSKLKEKHKKRNKSVNKHMNKHHKHHKHRHKSKKKKKKSKIHYIGDNDDKYNKHHKRRKKKTKKRRKHGSNSSSNGFFDAKDKLKYNSYLKYDNTYTSLKSNIKQKSRNIYKIRDIPRYTYSDCDDNDIYNKFAISVKKTNNTLPLSLSYSYSCDL